MGCSFFKFRLTVTHVLTLLSPSTAHTHTLMLESNYTAHSSDKNSPSTGPESHMVLVLMTLKAVLSLSMGIGAETPESGRKGSFFGHINMHYFYCAFLPSLWY